MARGERLFRVFVSSTFSDLRAERDALQLRVFPRLSALCAAHGTRFQAVDLRWGISEEAGLDQRTMAICLSEIARSQQLSPRPNFIVLLGDRYGWRPLPDMLAVEVYDALTAALPGDVDLLGQWYRRDDNAVPPVYTLQPRTGPYEDHDTWAAVERRLGEILRTTAVRAGLDDARLSASATEQEIIRGLFEQPGARDHVFAFLRTLEVTQTPPAGFIDTLPDGTPDATAASHVAELKARLRETLGDHAYIYHATPTGLNDTPITTAHLDVLCNDVYTALETVIQAEIAALGQVTPLAGELAAHAAFAADRAPGFRGQTDALSQAMQYLTYAPKRFAPAPTRPDGSKWLPLVNLPLAVLGASGAGKSTFMAQLVARAQALTQPAPTVIARFIGVTPTSRNIRTLLTGICDEYDAHYPLSTGEASLPTAGIDDDLPHIITALRARLTRRTPDHPLVLVLDALDQLDDAENARALGWLPLSRQANPFAQGTTRIVVSAAPGEAADALTRRLPPDALLTLSAMQEADADALLQTWLDAEGRALTSQQSAHVLEAFVHNRLPLYLRLAYEEARRWHSYDSPPKLPGTIPDLIRGVLFARLANAREHGAVMVERALAYLAVAQDGLSEAELLELLGADDDVYAEFLARAKHPPPAGVDGKRRLPDIIWSRLYTDLEPYFAERGGGASARLLTFFHRQFREAIDAEWLTDEQRGVRSAALARYFAAQPQTGVSADGASLPNHRKLTELLPALAGAGDVAGVLDLLTDPEFLELKALADGLPSAVEAVEAASVTLISAPGSSADARQVVEYSALLVAAMRLAASAVRADSKQLPAQLTARLLPHRDRMSSVRRLLERIEALGASRPLLLTELSALQAAGGMLRARLSHLSNESHE